MKIFVLLSRIPYPLEKGDKLRAFNQIKFLSKNHEIILCALNDDKKANKQNAFRFLQPYCRSVTFIDLSKINRAINIIKALLTDKPLQVGYFYSRKAHKKITNIIKEHFPDHLYCQLARTAEYIKNQNIPKTLDYQDVFSKGVERRIHTSPFYFKPFLKLEYKRLLKYENHIFDKFDNKTIISIPDRNLIPHPEKEKIAIILNGVDTVFYKPIKREKEYELVFTGNMGYPPNVNSVIYLTEKILPIVREKMPEIKIMFAGASPDPKVKAVNSENIKVTGWVDDIRECYAKAKIFIAPMQIGTGLQNKLLEAMAMKIPCISSPLANNALKAKDGKEIIIGNSPEEYAEKIIYFLEHKNEAETIAENGYNFVHKNYNWENATQKLEKLMFEK
ncbi:MAG: glycosyltransferase [Bacteroidales bacterium]|nr:glycosyltransferase [Bacteroidales bacterium]